MKRRGYNNPTRSTTVTPQNIISGNANYYSRHPKEHSNDENAREGDEDNDRRVLIKENPKDNSNLTRRLRSVSCSSEVREQTNAL